MNRVGYDSSNIIVIRMAGRVVP